MMSSLPDAVEALIEELTRLPGIGRKTAQRLAFFLLKHRGEAPHRLAQVLEKVASDVTFCPRCSNLSEGGSLCKICENPKRTQSVICVVETPTDVVAIERTGAFNGSYHVLGGSINPLEGIGPEDLSIDLLMTRVEKDDVEELILANNATLDGDTTALYLARMIQPRGVKVTRLARGIPMGGDLEYSDEHTISRALQARTILDG
jgi:recombination protein RecR